MGPTAGLVVDMIDGTAKALRVFAEIRSADRFTSNELMECLVGTCACAGTGLNINLFEEEFFQAGNVSLRLVVFRQGPNGLGLYLIKKNEDNYRCFN